MASIGDTHVNLYAHIRVTYEPLIVLLFWSCMALIGASIGWLAAN